MTGAAALARTRTALVEAFGDARNNVGPPAVAATVGLLAALLLAPALPLGVEDARLAGDLYLAVAAVGLGLAVGLAGMPVLSQGAFLAIGAYTAALLTARADWPTEAAVLGGAVAAAVAGAAVGAATAWARSAVVAVATWLVAWLVALALVAFPRISGGAQGVILPEASLFGVRLDGRAHYLVASALVVLAVGLFVAVRRHPAGIALAAARQHRPAAEALGVPVARLRAGALAVCSAVGGLAGALGVHLAGVADAASYGPLVSFQLFVAVVLGGAASAVGGLVGVAFLTAVALLAETGGLEGQSLSRVQTLIAAAVLITALGALERGLVPAVWSAVRPRSSAAPGPPPAALGAPPPVAPAALAARGLAKRFGAVTALDAVDLDVRGGAVHALLGPNGSGKTTALRVLAGTLLPDGGTITLDGTPLDAEGVRARAERGVVATLQATAVFSELSVLDNAVVGARLRARHGGAVRGVLATPKARADVRATRARALAALDRVGLAHVAPEPAGGLDGAAQRRLMIAAALAAEPRVLLLDEPAAGAGPAEVAMLGELLSSLRARGLAIVLVEHNLRLVRAVADTATVLSEGRTVASGRVADVLASDAVRRVHLGRGL